MSKIYTSLGDRTRYKKITGDMPDTTSWLDFHFYNLVWCWNKPNAEDNPALGRWLDSETKKMIEAFNKKDLDDPYDKDDTELREEPHTDGPDEYTPETYVQIINAEVFILEGDCHTKGTIIKIKKGGDRHRSGNPILDTQMYKVEMSDIVQTLGGDA
eukprot:6872706-Ditylum_brightwellii.AAC.1